MLSTTVLAQTLLVVLGATAALALPKNFPRVVVSQDHFEVLGMRATTEVNPAAVINIECLDRKAYAAPDRTFIIFGRTNSLSRNIVFHDQNVAELAICGGIAGSIQKCGGAPSETVGQSGSAQFVLSPVDDGAHINISKGRWEQCVRAARAVCPTGSLRATCLGGSSKGDVTFTLDNP
jgi:hypothetical protein